MLDMFYSCFRSMLCRALWLTIQMQLLIPVQTRDSSIISTLFPRKDIYWQQLFKLQLPTFSNVSGGLTRPSVILFVSCLQGQWRVPAPTLKLWQEAIQEESKFRLHAKMLLPSPWCPNDNDEAVWILKQSIHSKKSSLVVVPDLMI